MAHGYIIDRQVGRRAMIGSTDDNAEIIERSYERVLDALQAHLAHHDFLFGERPGRSDFGRFGQLTPMLWWDPTPTAVAIERAPRAIMWIQWIDDLSWWRLPADGGSGWFGPDAIPATINALLAEAGRTYAPFMVANAQALMAGADEVVCEIDGHEYRQAPFKYQGKCLQWIRERYESLADGDRRRVDSILPGTGCDALLADAVG